jgi:hypothetical protein
MTRMSARDVARSLAIGLFVLAGPFALGAKLATTLAPEDTRTTANGDGTPDGWVDPPTAWPDAPLDICLVTRGARPAVWDGSAALTIEGTLVKAGPVMPALSKLTFPGTIIPCHHDPDRHIDIADGNGEVWRLLYSTGKVPVRQASLPSGSRLHLRVDARWGFAKGAGFMLRDDAGPILAVEEGAFGPGPLPDHQRPIAVSRGEIYDVQPDKCGDRVRHWLQLDADQRQRAAPGRAIPLTIGGARYGFVNLASDGWRNPRCADLLDRTSWILWRR